VGSGGGGSIISFGRMVYRQYPGSVLSQARNGIFQEQNRAQGNYIQYLDVLILPNDRSTMGKLIYSLKL
jgi:hypothetical protein